jgi:hypothetical protein
MRGRKAPADQAASKQPPRNKLLDAVTLCFAQKSNYSTQESEGRNEILALCAAEADVIAEYLVRCQQQALKKRQEHELEQEKMYHRAGQELQSMPDSERHKRSKIIILEERVFLTLGRLQQLEWLGVHLTEMLQETAKKEETQRYLIEKAQMRQRRHVDDVYGAKLFRAPLQQFGPCPFANPLDCPFRGNCHGSPIKDHKFVSSPTMQAAAAAFRTGSPVALCAGEEEDDNFIAAVNAIERIPTALLV